MGYTKIRHYDEIKYRLDRLEIKRVEISSEPWEENTKRTAILQIESAIRELKWVLGGAE